MFGSINNAINITNEKTPADEKPKAKIISSKKKKRTKTTNQPTTNQPTTTSQITTSQTSPTTSNTTTSQSTSNKEKEQIQARRGDVAFSSDSDSNDSVDSVDWDGEIEHEIPPSKMLTAKHGVKIVVNSKNTKKNVTK